MQNTEDFDEERWRQVQASSNHYNADQRAQDNGQDAASFDMGRVGEEDQMWQSALSRFQQESTHELNDAGNESSDDSYHAVGKIEADYPPTHSQIQSQEQQEQLDQQYARRMTASMDMMGSQMDMMQSGITNDYDPASPAPREEGFDESTERLSLWQTFKALYTQNPMTKFYILALVILLIATVTIIVVGVSHQNEETSKDCATASYNSEPLLLLPEGSQTFSTGGFGTSLSASSDYLVVGAPKAACNPQVSSCEDFTAGGGAYLYKRNNNNEWVLYSSFIFDDEKTPGDEFGKAVAISEDSATVVVGAPEDDKLGIAGGAVYVFEQPFSTSTPPIWLVSDDLSFNDQLGGSVSVGATTFGTRSPVRVTNVIAGASFHDLFGSSSGGVYVFSKFDEEPPASACGGNRKIEVGKWIQCQKILPDDGEAHDQFGHSVDISARTLVVGAMWDDDRGIDSGAAYVFSLGDDGNWRQQQKLFPTMFQSQAFRFGYSVATSGKLIVVGADLDDSQGEDSGAAYLYKLSDGVWNPESKLVPNINLSLGDNRNYECGFSVDIDNSGTTVVVGCPGAPGGGASYLYKLQENTKWALTEQLAVPSGTYSPGIRIGSSVALSTGEDGMAVVGYGEANGEVFSYRKDC